MKSPFVQTPIWADIKQIAQPCLYLVQSSALPISLPPLVGQFRVVAKVNELMALYDTAISMPETDAGDHRQNNRQAA